jgi:hypothetical protein
VATQYANYIEHTLSKTSSSSLNHPSTDTPPSKQLYFGPTTSRKQFASTLKAPLHLLIEA